MTETLAQIRAALRRDTKALGKLAEKTAEVTERRDGNLRRAVALGGTGDELAADTGLSPGRVSQIAPGGRRGRPKKQQPAEPEAGEPDRVPIPYRVPLADDELPERFRPGASERIGVLLAKDKEGNPLVTDRWGLPGPEMPTIFVDMASGRWVSVRGQTGQIHWQRRDANELLTQIPEPVTRVFLVGPRPQARGVADPAEACRAWYLTPVPGWVADGHYLENAEMPIGKWRREGIPDAPRVEVARAASWFDGGEYSADQAAQAWAILRNLIRTPLGDKALPPFGEDALLLTTPSTTGRDLWRRSIGRNRKGQPKTYPLLSPELRQLIHSTSGQGRWEVIPEGPQEIETFTHWDMRFAYSALTWGMPVGKPTMVTRRQWGALADEDQGAMLNRRGRWLVTATVPDGWEHVGLLGAPAANTLWCYPRHPGETFTTWTSGSELQLAARHGWRFTVHEGFHFQEDKVLNGWSSAITTLYQNVEKDPDIAPDLRELVRGALRKLVLTSLGAFASRSRPVTKSVPATRENEKNLPKTAPVRVVDGSFVWTEPGSREGWSERMDHPEWPAEVWARCRRRLLESPTAEPGVMAGALHVPPGSVLAMRVDGLSLACDPGWQDDGAVGRFRLKGRISRSLARPIDEAEGEACRRLAALELARSTE